jgi:hypothetical protein
MAAVLALTVTEHLFINHFAESRTCCTPHGCADQSTEQGASKTSNGEPEWTSHKPQGPTNFGAAGCACYTTGSTSSSANDATDLLCCFTRQDLVRLAARTAFKRKHDNLLQTVKNKKPALSAMTEKGGHRKNLRDQLIR